MTQARHAGTFIGANRATAGPYALGEFDTVLVNRVLHHLRDQHVGALLARVRQGRRYTAGAPWLPLLVDVAPADPRRRGCARPAAPSAVSPVR